MKYLIVHIAADTNKLVLAKDMSVSHEDPDAVIEDLRRANPVLRGDCFIIYEAKEVRRVDVDPAVDVAYARAAASIDILDIPSIWSRMVEEERVYGGAFVSLGMSKDEE